MLRFYTLFMVLICSHAHRYHRRTKNYSSFRGMRFDKSETKFFIRNTFLQVETELTTKSAPWRPRSSTGLFTFWLPAKAVVSSLRLKVKNRHTKHVEWFDGYVSTNRRATRDFRREFGRNNKAQLIYRWTNEQFAQVVLRARMKRCDILSIAVGWKYALELQYDRFRLFFPVPIPGAASRSVLSVHGTIVEDGRPINSITVESPGPMDVGKGNVVEPSCKRILNSTTVVPCDERIDTHHVEIAFEITFGQYRDWLSQHQKYRRPFWYTKQQRKQCPAERKKSKRGCENSHSGSEDEYKADGKGFLSETRKRNSRPNSIGHDLVFSVSYNHTLDPWIFFGVPAFYGGRLGDGFVNWVWGSDNDSCWMVGVSAEEIHREVFPAVQFYPVVRRATFFLDDNTGVTKEYYDKVKAAMIRIIREASVQRLANLQMFSDLLDKRQFDEFRVVVLSADGQVYEFPNVVAMELNKFALANETNLQGAINFLTHTIPDAPPCQTRPGFLFSAVQREFLRVMQEYINFVATLTAPGRNELSDIFYFSNSKPEGTNGNFIGRTRRRFVRNIRKKQAVLRAFTSRSYGQPIFTFGFGPNADFNLLDSISTNNWGATTMAFEDDSVSTVDVQAFQFYRGIGRVLMSRVQIRNFQAVYGSVIDFFSETGGGIHLDVNTSLSDSGMIIPLLRNSQHFNIFVEAPPVINGKRIVGFTWTQDFIPGGELRQSNLETRLWNRTRAIIYRPGHVLFRHNDKLNLTANFDDGLSLCQYGNVVKVQTLEKALRLKRMFPNDVGKSVPEIKNLIEAAGLAGNLQTSETSFVVAEIGRLRSSDDENEAYLHSDGNSGDVKESRLASFSGFSQSVGLMMAVSVFVGVLICGGMMLWVFWGRAKQESFREGKPSVWTPLVGQRY